ncbi:iron complex transport system permease protein [Paenibacillus sp. UNCCL117]|uniref:FecCD family ABC transporter permease n=1 Tax=unclassified Paenibacillus TaxID=185978 RepID=UPI000890134D|nr:MULTISPECIES: iron ABC transporter permease [unclassified Paenibacillus]SDE19183.1 iron complex transport system permease protein [Paenibacillus sp. cl123]SFW62064.1 iron complex transport system permease protein [Paenibacillus sp. UNCCL117]
MINSTGNGRSVSTGWSPPARKAAVTAAALLALILIVSMISAGAGEMFISPARVLRAVFGSGEAADVMVVQKLRLPRIVIALLVGAALAGSGALLQGMLRNPLASPDIIGVSGGASVAAVLFLTYGTGALSIRWLPAFALLGAAVVAAALYALAWKKGTAPVRFVLIGIGLSSLTSAATTMMIIFSPKNDAGTAYVWLTGSIYAANWENVLTLLPWALVLLPLAFLLSRHVNIGQLGDELATSAGSAVERSRLLLLLLGVGLAASAVSVGGGIGFVGLLAPHMARKLVGSSFARLLPVSALLGAAIVLLADLAGRTLFLPLDVPVGVFTSAIGAPFFIYLLYASRHS